MYHSGRIQRIERIDNELALDPRAVLDPLDRRQPAGNVVLFLAFKVLGDERDRRRRIGVVEVSEGGGMSSERGDKIAERAVRCTGRVSGGGDEPRGPRGGNASDLGEWYIRTCFVVDSK